MSDITTKRERTTSTDDDFDDQPSDTQRIRVQSDANGASRGRRWTQEQDDALKAAVEEFEQRNWKSIASRVPGRNHAQCLQRWNKVLRPGLVKGHWSFDEDAILERMVIKGCHSWGEVANAIPGRTAKQCRERWRNHLDPNINRGPFDEKEDALIQSLYEELGNRWTQIAEKLPGRTEDSVKIRFKQLNPNRPISAPPGRPRNPPGSNNRGTRSTAPPSPDEVVDALTAAAMNNSNNNGVHSFNGEYGYVQGAMSNDLKAQLAAQYVASYRQQIPSHLLHPTQNNAVYANSTFIHTAPEQQVSHVNPLAGHEVDDGVEDLNSDDVATLRDLLRSSQSGLLSFGKLTSSLTDMSPEDLLKSGELDDMLRAVALNSQADEESHALNADSITDASNGNQDQPNLSSFNNRSRSSSSSFRLSSGNRLAPLDDEDRQHLFNDLMEHLRYGSFSEDWARMVGTDDEYINEKAIPRSLDSASFGLSANEFERSSFIEDGGVDGDVLKSLTERMPRIRKSRKETKAV